MARAPAANGHRRRGPGPVAALGRSLLAQLADLEQVVAGLALRPVVVRPAADPPAPVLGRAPVGVRHLGAALPVGEAAVQLERGPPVHEHRRRVLSRVRGEQAGGPAFVQQPAELGRAVLADRQQQDIAADRRAVDRGPDEQSLRLLAERSEQVAQQHVGHGQSGGLRRRQRQLGRRGQPGGRKARLDRRAEAGGDRREAHAAGQEQRVQVFHGARVTAEQPPDHVQVRPAEQPERGQRPRQLDRAGPGQRPQVTEPQPRRRRHGHGKAVPAGDQQAAAMRRVGPAGQQLDKGRVTDGARAGFQRQVVVEVVQHEQQRHLAEDVLAEQGEALRPGQVGAVGRRHGFGHGAVPGLRVTAERGHHPGEKRLGGHLAGEHGGHALRFEPADPLGDLRREHRLADPADAVQHQAGQVRAGQLRGPAAALGRADREGRYRGGFRLGRLGVPGVMRQPKHVRALRLGGGFNGGRFFR